MFRTIFFKFIKIIIFSLSLLVFFPIFVIGKEIKPVETFSWNIFSWTLNIPRPLCSTTGFSILGDSEATVGSSKEYTL